MIVHDLDIPSIAVTSDEADAPLIVDANAVLPESVATKGFQPVAGRDSQILETASSVDCNQLCSGPGLDLLRQPANGMPCKDGGGDFAGETHYHEPT